MTTELDEKKPYGYIYKIDFPNGKVYIGITNRSLEQRKKEHKRNANAGDTKCLYKALRKYNMIDTFELIKIDTTETFEELCEKEIMYIFEYNSHYIYGYGYNMTYGGEGTNGWVATQEQREKNSEIIKKYFRETSGSREKASEAQKKRYEKSEEREKARERAIKQYEKPEAREKASEAQKKRFKKTEEREKARERAIKRFKKPEEKEKASQGTKKYYREMPGAREKASERQKKRFEKPEEKKRILDTMGKNKPFDVFTKDGTFIEKFTYQFEAKEYLKKEHNITSTINVCQVLNGKCKSSAGFIFKYK